jgi:ribosome-associated toxin RatA of RatAB toxin-antitoxin module
MYQLVCDFESYPEFLPWCSDTRLISRTDEEICGELEVSLVENERMDIVLRDGPFRKLHGGWRFTSLREDACKVELVLEFEFSGKLIDAAFGRLFNHIANTMVESFCKRADEIYDG